MNSNNTNLVTLRSPGSPSAPTPGGTNGQLIAMDFPPGSRPTLEDMIARGYTVVEEPSTKKGGRK